MRRETNQRQENREKRGSQDREERERETKVENLKSARARLCACVCVCVCVCVVYVCRLYVCAIPTRPVQFSRVCVCVCVCRDTCSGEKTLFPHTCTPPAAISFCLRDVHAHRLYNGFHIGDGVSFF